MIKIVYRSTGLSSVCLIVVLIVPLIQCSSIENEESSFGRFKRNTFTELGSKATASAQANAESFVVPIFSEKGGKPGSWPGAGIAGGWPGAGGKPGGWPGVGDPRGWPGAGIAGVWPGVGIPGGWDVKKGGSFGKIISEFVPGLDKTFVPIENILTTDALKPFAGIVDGATSSLFGGLQKGFSGKEGFEKSAGSGIDYSRFLTTYLATQSRGKSDKQLNGASISVA